VALEVGYVHLGEASANGTDSVLGTTSVTWEASGFMVAAVGSIPIAERFALLGKVGLFRWDVDVRASSSVFGTGSVSKTGTDLMFGLGGSMNLGRNLAVRVEWERFNDVGDENVTGEGDIDLLSASIVFRF
jgi:OmpA-OmpF porin, OOP family